MALPLTKDVLRGAYIFLNETPPFNKWNLPDAEDIVFKVAKGRTCSGWHTFDGRKHELVISGAVNGHTHNVIETMAHEMIHVHEHQSRVAVSGVEHSAAFRKWAAQVCRIHGFDPHNFV